MTESLCDFPYEDCDDYADIWTEKTVTVRKMHHCCECDGEILPGEKAGKADGLYDGTWYTSYRCRACLILVEMAATIEGICPLWGGLYDFIDNLNWMRSENKLPTPEEHRKKWAALKEPSDE